MVYTKKMNELEKLGKKYGTDKIGKHNYLPYYYDLFKDKTKDVRTVVEIGVAELAGLKMFRDFFPYAKIMGAEIDEKRVVDNDWSVIVQCDQSNFYDLEKLDKEIEHEVGTIILVVDDGSHKPEDQLFTCLSFMSMYEDCDCEMIYIIEDAADVGIVKYLKKYDVEIVKCGQRYDDRLIIVKK